MNVKECIAKIINLPKEFYRLQDKSMYELLKNTYYFEFQIQADEIRNELYVHPDLVKDWLNWSENKRSLEGYFFELKNEIYIVGYLSGYKTMQTTTYVDPIEACAFYIKKELESFKELS